MQNNNPETEFHHHFESVEHKPKFDWIMALIIATLFVVLVLFGCGCTTLKTGYYTVESVRGRTVNLKGVQEDIYFPTDTLKPGDKVKVKRVFREKDANIW